MPVTVVVVDDDADYRLIVRALVRKVADTVTVVGEAANGEEALAVVRRERPDLVITDLMMPRLNGIELTRRIRAELPLTRVILMSSHIEDAYRLMASDSGADAFVSKTTITIALLPAIHDVIRRGYPSGSGPLFRLLLPLAGFALSTVLVLFPVDLTVDPGTLQAGQRLSRGRSRIVAAQGCGGDLPEAVVHQGGHGVHEAQLTIASFGLSSHRSI